MRGGKPACQLMGVGMRSPSQSTVRRLFAVSGNCCSYPDCTSSLIADDGAVLGEICHIRARNEGGARFDASLTKAERHSFENLMLLCRNHHRIVDTRDAEHTVEMLLEAPLQTTDQVAMIPFCSILRR